MNARSTAPPPPNTIRCTSGVACTVYYHTINALESSSAQLQAYKHKSPSHVLDASLSLIPIDFESTSRYFVSRNILQSLDYPEYHVVAL